MHYVSGVSPMRIMTFVFYARNVFPPYPPWWRVRGGRRLKGSLWDYRQTGPPTKAVGNIYLVKTGDKLYLFRKNYNDWFNTFIDIWDIYFSFFWLVLVVFFLRYSQIVLNYLYLSNGIAPFRTTRFRTAHPVSKRHF